MDDVDVVPLFAGGGDPLEGRRVAVAQVIERLIREDDPPPEGVVGTVTLDHRHRMRGILLLHEQREVEARGTAAKDRDAHQGATNRLRPSLLFAIPGWSSASWSHSLHVTCLCIWSRPSQ